MKAYTDLEQSRKLAEILPLESADMSWVSNGLGKPFARTIPIKGDPEELCSCWSLAALLKVIPKKIKDFNVLRIDISEKDFSIWYDEIGSGVNTELPDMTMECPVDACYEMILKLHELNLL